MDTTAIQRALVALGFRLRRLLVISPPTDEGKDSKSDSDDDHRHRPFEVRMVRQEVRHGRLSCCRR